MHEKPFPPGTPWPDQHPPIPEARTTGLSQVQRALLVDIYQRTCAALQDDYTQRFYPTAIWGVSWATGSTWADTDTPQSHAASRSRTLRRLADRGLVVRVNNVSGAASQRTLWVRLTPAGLALAQRLTQSPPCMS
jgi:hypothetical protein